jgi:hypothetical protein
MDSRWHPPRGVAWRTAKQQSGGANGHHDRADRGRQDRGDVQQLRPAGHDAPNRSGPVCAIVTAIASFLYAVAFVILQNVVLSALFLTVIGLLSSAVLVAVYHRLRETDAAFALWALVLGRNERSQRLT